MYVCYVKILGLIENSDVNIISEKMVKKGTKRREILLLLLVCDLPFAPSLLYTAFLSVLTAVMCVVSWCQDNIFSSPTLPSFDLPCLACTFR